ncbi:MAG TPA: NAD(P)-dependent oxidoreductase [Terriglobia bacterium]|nr:NAD(P)-dependent oxidoreductase [Terriglobia bacterium]
MPNKIAFIGLGIMGQPMALNLINAGHHLTVYNRTQDKTSTLAQAGARVAASPAEAVRDAEIIWSIVSDTAAMEEVVLGPAGILSGIREGAVLIDSSTISPTVSRKFACHLAGKKAKMLDAPVTGSKHGAEKGELTFMIGGDREVFDRMMPVLNVLGKRHIYCGAHGSGLSAKLAQNAIQATMVEVFCEGFVLATKAGVLPETMMEIIQSSMARANLTDFKAPFIFKGDFTPYFPLKLMHKDLELAMEAAYAQNVPMPTTAAVKETYGAAKAQGKGNMDYAAVVTFLEELAGVKVRTGTQEKSSGSAS